MERKADRVAVDEFIVFRFQRRRVNSCIYLYIDRRLLASEQTKHGRGHRLHQDLFKENIYKSIHYEV